jgi:hypothetical protein
MTLPLNSVLLSNNNLVIIESLGPKTRAVIKTPTGEILYTGNYTFSATKEVIIQEAIISVYTFGDITIIESNLGTPPPPPSPPPSPQQIEQTRQEESAKVEKQATQAEQKTVEADLIQNATPSDLKAIGLAKLPNLITTAGNQVIIIIQPSLNNLITQFVEKYNTQGVCLSQVELNQLKQQRDSIVSSLNQIGRTLNIITVSLTGLSSFLTLLESAIKGIEITKITAQIAAVAFPALAATLPTTLNTLNQAKTQILIDNKGNSRLSKLSAIIGGATLAASLVSSYILIATESLKAIDLVLKTCDPNTTLDPISKEIEDISTIQLIAQQTQNQTTYNGFIIEIEEVPFNDTITRRKAVGKNLQRIPLVETELSFTTNSQILINELKLIIDRDNLKAY